jgi:hypothetical protein
MERVGVQDAFALGIPPDWKGGWFEGTWDFEPGNLPSASQDGPTFVVTITMQPGNYDHAKQPATSTMIQGNRALVWHPSALETEYAIEWMHCSNYGPCSSNFETQTLIVRVMASNEQLQMKYSSVGEQVVRTIANYDGSAPVHGTIRSTVQYDDFTKALVRFMDARVEGIGADELMCCDAPNNYNSLNGLYELNGEVAVSYVVTSQADTSQTGSTNVENLGITMTFSGGKTRTELIELKRDFVDAGPPPVIASMCLTCGGA